MEISIELSWQALQPTICFDGEIPQLMDVLMGDSTETSFNFFEGAETWFERDIVADALSISDEDDLTIYLNDKSASELGGLPQDIVADALKSALSDDDDLGVYLQEDRSTSPSSCDSADIDSSASSTTSGVVSSADYDDLFPWSADVVNTVAADVTQPTVDVTSQRPSYFITEDATQHRQQPQFLHHREQSQPQLRQPHLNQQASVQSGTRMASTPVDHYLANWLNQQISATVVEQKRPTSRAFSKPPESYISMISKAVLSLPTGRALLSDIYSYFTDTYEYYRTAPKTWKNAIRHNLSVNECFIKNGRAPNGRGYYWSVHPACVQPFLNGDFRRREARQLAHDVDKLQRQISNNTYIYYA